MVYTVMIMQQMRTRTEESILCFVSGEQTIVHAEGVGRSCAACNRNMAITILEGGLIMHKLPGGFVMAIPPQAVLDDYVVYLRNQLMQMDEHIIDFQTAQFCHFSELEATNKPYTPDEEIFPLNTMGQVTVPVNNYIYKGWLSHIFTYEFADEEE